MFYAISLKGNTKTAIPTTTSSKSGCPDTCPLKEKGCYAKYSFLGGYWEKLSNGLVKNSFGFDGLVKSIQRLPKGQLWRHNQAGDFDHNDGIIDSDKLNRLVMANRGKNGFTYTHHLPFEDNVIAFQKSNKKGFTINLSANDVYHADSLKGYNLPLVVLMPEKAPKVSYTPKGQKSSIVPS